MRKPQKTAVRIAATGARLAAGIVVSAACVAGAAFAIPAAWPTVTATPPRTTVTPVAADTLLSCTGPFLALGRDATQPDALGIAATPSVVSAAAPGSWLSAQSLALPAVPGGEAAAFTAPPSDAAPAQVAAAQSVSVSSEDLAGFAASACRPPSLDSWLVGGAGTTGSNDIVLVANPGAVAASVTFTEFGSQGLAPRVSELVVQPGTQAAVPLVGSAAGEPSPVVEVTSTGAPVRAALQSSLIRTLDPVGVDTQDAVPQPRTDFSLLGVRALVPSADDDATTAVRLLAPHEGATVTLQPRSAADGSAVGAPKKVKLTAGQVGSVDFSSLKPGLYGIDITSTAPVVAAARQTTGVAKGSDFAWMTPAPDITGTTTFAVAAGPSPQLHVQNASAQDVAVELAPVSGGASQKLTLKTGEAVTVPLTASTVCRLQAPTAVRAAVGFSGPGQLAGYPVWATDAAAAPIEVYQR